MSNPIRSLTLLATVCAPLLVAAEDLAGDNIRSLDGQVHEVAFPGNADHGLFLAHKSSLAAKKKAFSIAAFSSESEPWIALRSMDSP